MKSGVVIINKGKGLSSQAVVNRLKRLLGAKKAGHTGTLDPLATGVLPVLVERGVKASEYMLSSDKHYQAIMLLGITTDTEDVLGKVLTESDLIPAEGDVLLAADSMLGEHMQTPPMYSALKVGGEKLYDLARRGITVEREPRRITVHRINTKRLSDKEYELDVVCSKGTYIRTLCADIGKKLSCGAVMKELCRASCAGFSLEEAHTLDQIEAMSQAEREALIIPIEEIFKDKVRLVLPPFFARLARNGLPIYQKKIKTDIKEGERVALFDENGFFALGESVMLEDGAAIKPIKQFDT